MLIEFKVKSRMAICYLDWLRFRSQQVLDMLLYKQGAAEDSHDLVDVSFKLHLMLDYCDDAVSADGRIDLYFEKCDKLFSHKNRITDMNTEISNSLLTDFKRH